jgi:CheY-like chemotaxis protein
MKNKKILIVEDSPEILLAIKSKLLGKPYDLIFAQNGKEALNLIKEKPDLIWLDMYLPIMGGVEFLKELKKIENANKIPVIVVSVSKCKSDLLEEVEEYENICEVIIKSEVKIKEIVEKIEKILSE